MKTIPLTNSNLVAFVDDEDFESLSGYKWNLNKRTGVPQRCVRLDGKITTIKMSRQIMGDSDFMVDHEDHVKLNNQKNNLRLATRSQNGANRIKQSKPTSSRFKGVHRLVSGRFTAHIVRNKKKLHLGTFVIEEDAARAYDEAANHYFKEFSYPNTQ